MSDAFDTPLAISGPYRQPRQMLAEQEYGGHLSIHDGDMAEKFGFAGGPIEGPTHFSQFVPLLTSFWGTAYLESGCISAHYQNVVVEGEEVRAYAAIPADGARTTEIWAEKKDGTPVLKGTASVGPDHPETELDSRMARLRPAEKLVILADFEVGMRGGEPEVLRVDPDQNLGPMYPFSLAEKLKVITEPCPWYTESGGESSPWGRSILPLEMVSVMVGTAKQSHFPTKGPCVGLFADLEVRLLRGPLFVSHDYSIEQEVVALSASRRTESYWVRTDIRDAASGELVAQMLLNQAQLKESYANYEQELAGL